MSRRVALFGRFLARKRGDLARAACLNVHCKGRHQAAFLLPRPARLPMEYRMFSCPRLYEPGSVVFPYRSCAGSRRFGDRPWRHLEVSYVTATNGGGAFLLMFLLFSFTLGWPCWWVRPCSAVAASAGARCLPQAGGAELALDGVHGDPVRLLHLQLLQRGGRLDRGLRRWR